MPSYTRSWGRNSFQEVPVITDMPSSSACKVLSCWTGRNTDFLKYSWFSTGKPSPVTTQTGCVRGNAAVWASLCRGALIQTCDLPYCLTLRLSVCILSSCRTSCGLTRSGRTWKIRVILKCKTSQLKPSQFHSLCHPLTLPGKQVQGFQRLAHKLSFQKRPHSFIVKWEVSLRERDVNCLQSQSLVTMSAKHHTWLWRSAGRLDLSAQTPWLCNCTACSLEADWVQPAQNTAQTSLHLAARDLVRHTHDNWHQLKTLLWFRKHQCQKIDWGCWTSTAELFPQQLCTWTEPYSLPWQRRWGWNFCPHFTGRDIAAGLEWAAPRASHEQPTRPWKELYYEWLCTEDCWGHVLGSAPCQEEARLWNLKACPIPPHCLTSHHLCGVLSGFKNWEFCLMEVKPQNKFGHLLSQHILWLK